VGQKPQYVRELRARCKAEGFTRSWRIEGLEQQYLLLKPAWGTVKGQPGLYFMWRDREPKVPVWMGTRPADLTEEHKNVLVHEAILMEGIIASRGWVDDACPPDDYKAMDLDWPPLEVEDAPAAKRARRS
jgi:hypothetical protein